MITNGGYEIAIDSKLRGCDVVKVKIGDIVSGGRVRSRATVVQQKTGRLVQFENWRRPTTGRAVYADAPSALRFSAPSAGSLRCAGAADPAGQGSATDLSCGGNTWGAALCDDEVEHLKDDLEKATNPADRRADWKL